MRNVEYYIYNFTGQQKEIMEYIHNLMMSFPEIVSKIRYKIPFYYRKSWICYLNPIKNNKVEFAFTRGNELSNEQGLLESKERKQVYSITILDIKEIPRETILEIIQEAILLDETKPYVSKRK
ncbi:MAG: DUF1801 domain-containing protein [Ignavibacteriae bacterium]|nr:DUF1801 domain-containing protein [Ignavibacteriota bacterium]